MEREHFKEKGGKRQVMHGSRPKGAFLGTGYFLPLYMSYDSMILLIARYVTACIIFHALHTRYTIRTDVPSCGRCVSCRAGQQVGGSDL